MDRSFAGILRSSTIAVFGFTLLGLVAGCGGGSVAPSSNLTSNSSNPGASSGGNSSNGGGASAGSSSTGSNSSGSGSGASSGGGSGNSGGSGSGGGTPASMSAFLYVGMDDTYGTYYGASLRQTGHASIAGFLIAADGSLQATPSSPYAGPAAQLAANGGASAVYAASGSTLNVNRINSDGSLTTTATLTAQPLSPSIGIYESVSFDAPARMLYAVANHGAGDEFFEIYRTGGDGSLTNNGSQQATVSTSPLYFTADGMRAYEPFCYHLDGEIFGQNIGSDGKLTRFDSNARFPSMDGGSSSPCPHALAVSPDTKFVAATINGVTNSSAALGIWSINSDGTLSAVAGSPYSRTAIAEDIAWDPLGRYIAIAAKDGLWIYSFSAGSAPVAVGGTPVITGPIDHLAFNKAGTLLFAVNAAAQGVYVFNFNSSTGTATPAPGSPHQMSLAPYELAVAER